MKLPRIYDFYVTGQILRFDQLGTDLELSGNSLRKRISELASRGYLIPVRQGLYILNSPAIPLLKCRNPQVKVHFDFPNPLEIGTALSPSCTIGYVTALAYWAGRTNSTDTPVIVISRTKFNNFSYQGFSFVWCQDCTSLSQTLKLVQNGSVNAIQITGVEQTIIDCLKRPMHCPSWATMLEYCLDLPCPDPWRLSSLARCADSSALNSRLGLLLTYFQELWRIPSDLLSELEDRRSRKDQLWKSGNAPKVEKEQHLQGIQRAAARSEEWDSQQFSRWNVWPESPHQNDRLTDPTCHGQTS